MNRTVFGVAALAALFAIPNAYAETYDHQGFSVGVNAINLNTTFDYTNADKPDNDLEAFIGTLELGYNHQFELGGVDLVAGVSYETMVSPDAQTDLSYNGNYITNQDRLTGFDAWKLRAGIAFGNLAVFGIYGQAHRQGELDQYCPPDWNAVVAGFCRAGGNAVLADQREGLSRGSYDDDAPVYGVEIEWNFNENVSLNVGWEQIEWDAQTVAYDPDPAIVPGTTFNSEYDMVRIGLRYRF